MGLLIALIALVLIGVVAVIVGAPLRRARGARDVAFAPERDELEAAREAKYREIRDAQLDYRTGKLSREDYEAIDAQLRAEAIAILDQLERLTSKDA